MWERAEQLAEAAHTLSPDAGDLRLRAIILSRQGKLDEAIHCLDGVQDPDSVYLRTALLLDRGRYDEAALVLEKSTVVDEPSAETYRLRALLRLAVRDVAGAQFQIQKALELAPRWQTVRFAAAVIDYFSALSPAALPDALLAWPWPVEWDFVKTDDESQAYLRRAAIVFQQLHEQECEGGDFGVPFQIWHLASLANDPEAQETALELCKVLLEHDPGNYPGVVWGLARAYSFSIEESCGWLEKRVTAQQASVSDVMSLTTCYLHLGKAEESHQLLERTEDLFQQRQARELWLQQKAHVSNYLHTDETAGYLPEAAEDNRDSDAFRAEVLWQRARRSDDWKPLAEYLEVLHDRTGSPFWLYQSCIASMRCQRWNEVADKALLLVQKVGTGAALRLAATACYNARRHGLCLSLLADNAFDVSGQKAPE